MKVEETLDELRNHDLKIIQPRAGYRFSLDPLLLCDFAGIREGERVIDLGTGSGVIPLVLARKSAASAFVGVEFQKELADLAIRNIALNGLEARIGILLADVLHLKGHSPGSSFDLVTANPPYRAPGSGKISPARGRDAARHETTAGLADFLAGAKYLVKPSGRICLIYHVSRLVDCLGEAERQKLAVAKLQFVHGFPGAEARTFMAELAKGRKSELKVLAPLFVNETDTSAPASEYTDVRAEKELC